MAEILPNRSNLSSFTKITLPPLLLGYSNNLSCEI